MMTNPHSVWEKLQREGRYSEAMAPERMALPKCEGFMGLKCLADIYWAKTIAICPFCTSFIHPNPPKKKEAKVRKLRAL